MAAVRRRSGAGIVVALVFFVVLAFVGIGGCIWFYQELELRKSALAETNRAVETHIGEQFGLYNWPWDPKDERTGLKYTEDVLAPVSDKLAQARVFEQEYRTVVGFDTADDIESALENASGDQDFDTVRGLVEYHNQKYTSLVSTTEQLRNRVSELERLRTQDQADYRDKLEKEQQEFANQINELRQDIKRYEETKNQLQEDLQAARRQKEELQSELNERVRTFRARLAEMKQTTDQLQKRIRELQSPPSPEEIPELIASGQVTAYKPETGFRVFSGGENQNILPNDQFVVYTLNEDGEPQRKARIQVSAVHDRVSEFYVVEKQEEVEIEQGDKVVELSDWQSYQQAVGVR
jgi:DNA repair exonuclease SbcCD ATPase subunit